MQPNELGPKDTVRTPPQAVTRIVMQWPDDPRFHGDYVYHCHILAHEDNDMMRPLRVLPPLPPGKLAASLDLLTGRPVFELGTAPGVAYALESAPDVTGWLPLTETIGTGRTYLLADPQPPDTAARFYRALTGP